MTMGIGFRVYRERAKGEAFPLRRLNAGVLLAFMW